MSNYNNLLEMSKEIGTLSGIAALLSWDQETYMPKGAIHSRSKQIATISKLIHDKSTSKAFENALGRLIDISSGKIKSNLSPEQKVAVKEWRRIFLRKKRLPTKFVQKFSELTSQSIHVWIDAKKENSFLKFAPFLEKIVQMSREMAELIGYKKHPYDALLDEYEPNMRTADVSKLFKEIKPPIIALLKKIKCKKQVDNKFLFGSFAKSKQLKFSNEILKAMGYDKNYGRIDLSEHPFTTNFHPTDVRITTFVDPSCPLPNIFSTIHEVGHALYEMGLPAKHYGSPLCEAISFGFHESQSRFWENHIGKSKSFWKDFLPILKGNFPQLKNISPGKFYRAINRVEPSPIRIEADEVSYNLHIILRFEIECALIEGKLKIRDLPEAWNEKMKEYFGITPKNDREGCLQDIHWSMGGFGYFPTYTLGNLYAAMFAPHVKGEDNLFLLKKWLSENIHKHGKRYSAPQLIKKITGKPLSHKPFIRYLAKKYSEIYNF